MALKNFQHTGRETELKISSGFYNVLWYNNDMIRLISLVQLVCTCECRPTLYHTSPLARCTLPVFAKNFPRDQEVSHAYPYIYVWLIVWGVYTTCIIVECRWYRKSLATHSTTSKWEIPKTTSKRKDTWNITTCCKLRCTKSIKSTPEWKTTVGRNTMSKMRLPTCDHGLLYINVGKVNIPYE